MGVTRRVTLAEAAVELGISKDAVRKRIKRETLRSDKDPDGRVYVYLDAGGDAGTPGPGPGQDPRDRLISTLQEQLEAERAANREMRRLLAAALERIPAIESPEATESPVTPSEAPEGVEVPDRGEGPQRRSWWRRMFGSKT